MCNISDQSNICHNSSNINKIGIIITTLHQVSGDTTLQSLTINNLTNKQLHYSIPKPTYRRKIFFRKAFWSLPWVHMTSANSIKLSSSKQFLNPKFLLQFSSPTTTRRTCWLRSEYGIHDSKRRFLYPVHRYDRRKT